MAIFTPMARLLFKTLETIGDPPFAQVSHMVDHRVRRVRSTTPGPDA